MNTCEIITTVHQFFQWNFRFALDLCASKAVCSELHALNAFPLFINDLLKWKGHVYHYDESSMLNILFGKLYIFVILHV